MASTFSLKFHAGLKGQKELSMIITLIILLVVAVVTIALFLRIFQEPKIGKDAMELQKIKQECTKACQEAKEATPDIFLASVWNYCINSFRLKEQESGGVDVIIGKGVGENAYCIDGLFCFLIPDERCYLKGDYINPEKCLEYMCRYALKIKNNDVVEANKMIRDNMKREKGSCRLEQGAIVQKKGGSIISIEAPTWYETYFKNPDCSGFLANNIGTPPSFCGNGVCDPGETPDTCPSDCAGPPPPP
jgi:hypothetical protein